MGIENEIRPTFGLEKVGKCVCVCGGGGGGGVK